MIERTEFELPEGENELALASRPAQAPVIVIEYRSRVLASRLMPAVLILFASLALASYQRKTPVLPLVPRPAPVVVAPPQSAFAGPRAADDVAQGTPRGPIAPYEPDRIGPDRCPKRHDGVVMGRWRHSGQPLPESHSPWPGRAWTS